MVTSSSEQIQFFITNKFGGKFNDTNFPALVQPTQGHTVYYKMYSWNNLFLFDIQFFAGGKNWCGYLDSEIKKKII